MSTPSMVSGVTEIGGGECWWCGDITILYNEAVLQANISSYNNGRTTRRTFVRTI